MVSLLIYAVLVHGIALNKGINTITGSAETALHSAHASLVTHKACHFYSYSQFSIHIYTDFIFALTVNLCAHTYSTIQSKLIIVSCK